MLVAQDTWEGHTCSRSTAFLSAKILAEFDAWAAEPERSEAFVLAQQAAWEDSKDRSDAFRAAKLLVDEEAFCADAGARSELFSAARLLCEEEEWEGSPARSLALRIAAEEAWEEEHERSEAFVLARQAAWEESAERSAAFLAARSAIMLREATEAEAAAAAAARRSAAAPSIDVSSLCADDGFVMVTSPLEEVVVVPSDWEPAEAPGKGSGPKAPLFLSPNNVADLPFHIPPEMALHAH